jgi:RNA polymerase sigma-70 factor, ECF subfamily
VRWRTVRHYDDPVGWVRRVAINLLHDDHRRATRKRRAIARLAAEQAESTDPPEPDGLADLLATLPQQQRVAVALYYVDGLSVAEAAAAMGLAEGSVKSHLHDARRRLRAALDREER